MSERDNPAARLCQRYIQVWQSPNGQWRARLVCRMRNRDFLGLSKPSLSEAIRDAYRAAGDPRGMGLPVFDSMGRPERDEYDPSGQSRNRHP